MTMTPKKPTRELLALEAARGMQHNASLASAVEAHESAKRDRLFMKQFRLQAEQVLRVKSPTLQTHHTATGSTSQL